MRIKQKAIAALLVLLAFPGSSQATISEYLTAADGDPTIEMLGSLFGPVPGIIPGTPSPLSEMFVIFNMAVFSVAVLMVLYGIISGVMHTAVEGEFLGKRLSSIWYPIRVIYGVFGLVPLFGGYSFPQALMILGMVVGIGIGNITWDAGWKHMIGHVDQMVLSSPQAAIEDESIEALISAQVCSVTHNLYEKQAATESGKMPILYPESGVLSRQGTVTKLLFGSDSAEAGHFPDSCGGVLVYPKSSEKSIFDGPLGLAALPPFDSKAVAKAQALALENMSKSLLPWSRSLALEGQAPSSEALAGIKKKYVQDVSSALAEATVDTRSGFSSWMSKEGHSWLYSGVIFLKITGINREIIDAASAEVKPISPGRSGIFSQALDRATGIVTGWTKTIKNVVTLDFPRIFGDAMESAGMAAAMRSLVAGEGDLLTGLTSLGHTLTIAGAAGLTLVAGSAITPGIGSAITALGLPTLFQILALLGILMAFFLPFMPFILWFGGVISYFIVLIEAVVAAPLWMLAHLDTEGEGMGQKTAHGYMFLLNVIFRPVLMIFGLVGGWLLMLVLGKFLQYSLSVIYGSSSFAFSGWASVGAFLSTLIIFCYLSYILISRCFSLINHLPNEVLAWVGGHVGRIGGHDEDRNIMAGIKSEGSQIRSGGSIPSPSRNAIKGASGGNTIRPGGDTIHRDR
ncbi:MAG: DotA/TraY family protein [Desulfobulbia bacterium]